MFSLPGHVLLAQLRTDLFNESILFMQVLLKVEIDRQIVKVPHTTTRIPILTLLTQG